MDRNLKVAWLKYEKVRRSGKYNMIMEWNLAAKDAGLTETQYSNVIRRYSALRAQIEKEHTPEEIDKLIKEIK